MPVFNKLIYDGTEYTLGGGGNIGEPLNLTVTATGLDATITWEDNEIGTIPPTSFVKSELVRKIGSAPTSPSDGYLVVTETVKDTYKVSGYVDQGLTDGETYYYRVFSYSDLGGISYCDAESVTISGTSTYTITGSTSVGSFTPPTYSDIQGCYISPDGDKMYINFWNSWSGILVQYSMSTPRDVTTATQVQTLSTEQPDAICFSDDGSFFYTSRENDHTIKRYSMSTPRDISTATQDQSLSVNNYAYSICFSEDGDYIFYNDNQTYYQYELITPRDLTSATNQKSYTISGIYIGISVRNEGKYLYLANEAGNPIKQYELDTPYDITSNKTEIGTYTLTGGNDGRAFYVSPDGQYRVFGIGNSGASIGQFEAQPIS